MAKCGCNGKGTAAERREGRARRVVVIAIVVDAGMQLAWSVCRCVEQLPMYTCTCVCLCWGTTAVVPWHWLCGRTVTKRHVSVVRVRRELPGLQRGWNWRHVQ